MQTLPSFLQSLFLYALTSPASTALRSSVPDRKTYISHNTPKLESQNAFTESSQYITFLLDLFQRAQEEDVRSGNLHKQNFGSGVKRKTVLHKFKSKHGHSHFPRASRARLDRMPLAFGKRAESEGWGNERGDEFEREVRGRIHRMPLTFGKRLINGIYKNVKSTTAPTHVPNVDLYDQISSDGNGRPFLKRQSNRLVRMPITFGKRVPAAMENHLLDNPGPENKGSADDENRAGEIFNRGERASLSRMPLTFGKRQKTAENLRAPVRQDASQKDPHHISFGRQSLPIALLGKLTSGDADKPLTSFANLKTGRLHDSSAISKDDVILPRTSPEKRLELLKSYMSRGTTGQVSPAYFYPCDEFLVKRRTVMNRMPLTFGKRNGPVGARRLGKQFGPSGNGVNADKMTGSQRKIWLYRDNDDGDDKALARTEKRLMVSRLEDI